MKKTYGAPGYMDWVALVPAGKSTVKVHFTGGALTAYGVTPAEYTTDNPFFQKLIEGSAYYKDGRIVLVRTVEDATEASGKSLEASGKSLEASGKSPRNGDEQAQASAAGAATAETAAEDAATAEAATAETEAATAAAEGAVVKAACVQDAQSYLTENYGIPGYRVRTRESIEAAAKERGITIEWT